MAVRRGFFMGYKKSFEGISKQIRGKDMPNHELAQIGLESGKWKNGTKHAEIEGFWEGKKYEIWSAKRIKESNSLKVGLDGNWNYLSLNNGLIFIYLYLRSIKISKLNGLKDPNKL